ncbi:LOW QUALITY PROTEIN: F-box DNA helicase 1 [Pithys albifrons albifrons]|uniref:LOW QUALITY PROTEIN: F-box DNA helicase 1 n=1 Tax=Pithys albifrons albifrons TaxID=3385563 RepID=UPI003A5D1885
MRPPKKRHLPAPECEALSRSTEGLAALAQPLAQPLARGTARGHRGLLPTQRVPRHRGRRHQRNIRRFLGKSQQHQGGTKSCGIPEDSLDPFLPGAEDPWNSHPSLLPEEEDPVPIPRNHPLPAAASGIPDPERDWWGQPEEIPGVLPELPQPRQDQDDVEVEPIPDAHYGLLGTRSWEEPEGHLEQLPMEVLRNIFGFLPVAELYLSLSLVCHCWRDIIRDPLFIPWKKLHHQYLLKETTALHRVEQILREFSISKENEGSVLGLIRLVSAMPVRGNADPGAALRSLGSHHLFPRARDWVANQLPQLQGQAEAMWATFAGMVLCSRSVGDIQGLLERLRTPQTSLSLLEVTEGLYCMATVLLAMRDRDIPIPSRIHYNIFHCLYLMENPLVEPLEEETPHSHCSFPKVRLTHEQQRILNHQLQPGHVVKILGFAGTGKTWILGKYAEKFPELKFLYVTSHEAEAEKGKREFPGNITWKTFHSLALGDVGKGCHPSGHQPLPELSLLSQLHPWHDQSRGDRARRVAQTLQSFCCSRDREIREWHIPEGIVDPRERRLIVAEAQEIWHNLEQLDGNMERRFRMSWDGILKLWQLSRPRLEGYDAILVDEAQDCTPAVLDVLLAQECGIILAGDPHQRIHPGTGNALSAVSQTHLYHLSQSFRFGSDVAAAASALLGLGKGLRRPGLLGRSCSGREFRDGPKAVLARSDSGAFTAAAELSGNGGNAIHVLGGLAGLGLGRISDIWKLSRPAEIREKLRLQIQDGSIGRWARSGGLRGLRELAERGQDTALQEQLRIVQRHRERLPQILPSIRNCHVCQEGLADYVIGTVHQAKGREFHTVLVAEDFLRAPGASGASRSSPSPASGLFPEEEWNLLYIAMTRARKCLQLPKSLEHLLSLDGDPPHLWDLEPCPPWESPIQAGKSSHTSLG